MESNKTGKNIFRNLIIAIFSAFIAVSSCVALLCFYTPNHNNLQALCSVSMDVVSIIILFILFGSFTFGNYSSIRATRLFNGLLAVTIWALFLDMLNWIFDGRLAAGSITGWFTIGSLCMGAVLALVYSNYLCSYMEETYAMTNVKSIARICTIVNAISFVLTFTLAITGTAFEFVDGHYEIGALYDGTTIIPILTLLLLTGFSICHIKKIGFHDVVAVTGYILFMIAGVAVEAMYTIGTTYVSVAIADIYIFVMLQNEVLAKEKQNARAWMEKSSIDELTGLYNRYAYEEEIANLEKGNIAENFVYVSSDVNSLKMTNDSLGHTAGDELLLGAVKCLKEAMGQYGKLYRIGGDEFIALIYADEEQLNDIKNNIQTLSSKWSGSLVNSLSISCGYVTRKENSEMSVRQMAILADQKMYEAKGEYYQRTGIERRRR